MKSISDCTVEIIQRLTSQERQNSAAALALFIAPIQPAHSTHNRHHECQANAIIQGSTCPTHHGGQPASLDNGCRQQILWCQERTYESATVARGRSAGNSGPCSPRGRRAHAHHSSQPAHRHRRLAASQRRRTGFAWAKSARCARTLAGTGQSPGSNRAHRGVQHGASG